MHRANLFWLGSFALYSVGMMVLNKVVVRTFSLEVHAFRDEIGVLSQ